MGGRGHGKAGSLQPGSSFPDRNLSQIKSRLNPRHSGFVKDHRSAMA